jgi:hypothetical protein
MTHGIVAATPGLGRRLGAGPVRGQLVGTHRHARRTRYGSAAGAASASKARDAVRHAGFAILVALLLLTGSGLASAASSQAAAPDAAGAAGTTANPSCGPLTSFNRHDFAHSTTINNRRLPLKPGTLFVFQGLANRGRGLLPHRVVTIVTDLTKTINGVRARVVVDLDLNAGQLEEAELALFAQDDAGNVWSLGEYPEVYEDGKFSEAPDVWIAGVADAQAGVVMPAKPRLGTPSYRQGIALDIEFFDCGKVLNVGARTCVPGKCYDNVVVIDEWDPLDLESGHQRKFHADGVGIVRVAAVNDPEGETLVLSEVRHLDPRQMAKARKLALRLERRAYQVSDVYRHTPPARAVAEGRVRDDSTMTDDQLKYQMTKERLIVDELQSLENIGLNREE